MNGRKSSQTLIRLNQITEKPEKYENYFSNFSEANFYGTIYRRGSQTQRSNESPSDSLGKYASPLSKLCAKSPRSNSILLVNS